ncbi:MAG: hypothetical protein ABIX28_13785 [Vicinamibacterales bacterium]
MKTASLIAGLTCAALAGAVGPARGACVPSQLGTPAPRDPVALVLAAQPSCPRTPLEFRRTLTRAGARLEPTMVNFVGFHNPGAGAFFIFEIASGTLTAPATTIARGDLLFGHFTTATGDGRLVSQDDGSLIIELIAWDPGKQFYNFYELRSTGWVYRGDSGDVLEDIALLHRKRPAGAPAFGTRLRCSGCHVSGGLLQKELVAPHNDWFRAARPLPMGGLKPDPAIKEILDAVVDAEILAPLVTAGAQRLADSPGYRTRLAARTLQEQLRPLFCAVELNIESDAAPFDDRAPTVRIPSGFFVDARLATAEVTVARQHYDAALTSLSSRLPDTPGRQDADHAWLTPVKATSDIIAVQALIDRKIVDEEFVLDVLSVDATNPVFSAARCRLLQLVPEASGASWVPRFIDALRGGSGPGTAELLSNLTDPAKTAAFHRGQAAAFTAACATRAGDPAATAGWFALLAQRRVEVGASEISSNSRGHILEDPGRVVFPATRPAAQAGRLSLTTACEVR